MASAAALSAANTGLGIRFDRIERRFGALVALRSLSLEIAPGEFVALLGHNGAGKTTLLRITAQLMRPSRGSVRFFAASAAREVPFTTVKGRTGLVGHSLLLYDELSAEENLTLFARLYALDKVGTRVTNALEACGLSSRATSQVRTFSRGMRQRLAIARALLHSPRLLLLDEPAAGLDRQGLEWLGAMLERLRGDGCTVIMSTHARNESLDLATRAIVLAGGRLQQDTGAVGDPRPLLQELRAES
ncbi:MAG TPA: ABC transporter ATP-binding protein [Candidatus Acidoferrales bacterium]|nr:ABC transporter ATP-binding protein [Candidatus Acidoferrales bacterium]